jgi:CheY-like chemotaxis protein
MLKRNDRTGGLFTLKKKLSHYLASAPEAAARQTSRRDRRGSALGKSEDRGTSSTSATGLNDNCYADAEIAIASPERPLRVLVADDSSDNRFLLSAFLKAAGYITHEAENGATAVQQFKQNCYHVVLMDLRMPVIDGCAAAREIRIWEITQGLLHTPIIALTASSFGEDLSKSLEAGCDIYLSKPVRRVALLAAVQKAIEAPRSAAEPAYEVARVKASRAREQRVNTAHNEPLRAMMYPRVSAARSIHGSSK